MDVCIWFSPCSCFEIWLHDVQNTTGVVGHHLLYLRELGSGTSLHIPSDRVLWGIKIYMCMAYANAKMSSDVPQRWTKYVLTNILVSSCNLEWSRRKQFLLELTLKSYATLVSEAVVHIKVCTKPHYQKCWCTNVTDYEISLKVAYIWHAVTAIAPRSHPHTDMQCIIILYDEQNMLFIHYPCMYAYIACKPPVHAHTK